MNQKITRRKQMTQHLFAYLKAYGLTLAVLLVVMIPILAVLPHFNQPSEPQTIKDVIGSAFSYVIFTIIFSLPFLFVGFLVYVSFDRHIPVDKRIILYPVTTLFFALIGIIGITLYQKLSWPNEETIPMAVTSVIFSFIGYTTIGFSLIFGLALWFVKKSNSLLP